MSDADPHAAPRPEDAEPDSIEALRAELDDAHERLVLSEQFAQIGRMMAGIAHEIKNPLNFVNNFAQLSVELAEEVDEVLEDMVDEPMATVREELGPILEDLKTNAAKIAEHGKRADSIVKSMLLHASGKINEPFPLPLNPLVEEYVALAYHGSRAMLPGFNVTLEPDYRDDVGEVPIIPQEIGRVLINLLNNAFYAVYQRAIKLNGTIDDEGRPDPNGAFSPHVWVSTRREGDTVTLEVRDNGGGIPDEVMERLFEPFFTTKPTGSGTGLGLPLSYEIVTEHHGGRMEVSSVPDEGATFTLHLPAP